MALPIWPIGLDLLVHVSLALKEQCRISKKKKAKKVRKNLAIDYQSSSKYIFPKNYNASTFYQHEFKGVACSLV